MEIHEDAIIAAIIERILKGHKPLDLILHKVAARIAREYLEKTITSGMIEKMINAEVVKRVNEREELINKVLNETNIERLAETTLHNTLSKIAARIIERSTPEITSVLHQRLLKSIK